MDLIQVSMETRILLLEIKMELQEVIIGYLVKDLMDKSIKILFLIILKLNLIKLQKCLHNLNKLLENGELNLMIKTFYFIFL